MILANMGKRSEEVIETWHMKKTETSDSSTETLMASRAPSEITLAGTLNTTLL